MEVRTTFGPSRKKLKEESNTGVGRANKSQTAPCVKKTLKQKKTVKRQKQVGRSHAE